MAENSTTRYIILENIQDLTDRGAADGVWRVAGQRDDRSADAALRAHGQPGRFVAIPERSWKPVALETETVTRLKLVDPGATPQPVAE